MTLLEMSALYAESAAALRRRIGELRQAARELKDEEDRRLLRRRITELTPLLQETRELVRLQEGRYRYPVSLIARPRNNLTAYPFGYLYPAAELFFWHREEEQVHRERFDPFFMNIWDFRRTLGLESLLFKK